MKPAMPSVPGINARPREDDDDVGNAFRRERNQPTEREHPATAQRKPQQKRCYDGNTDDVTDQQRQRRINDIADFKVSGRNQERR